MDKNFVNIDNLVRQRLGGGEEQERSGAWLRMSELLDKEMPQEKAIGLFYWRRMLSAVAVLLLIATISVGGYKLSADRAANSAAHNDAAVSPVSNNIINAPVKNNEVTNTRISTSGIADNSQPGNDGQNDKQQNDKKLSAGSDNKPVHKQLAANDKISTTKEINKDELTANNNSINNEEHNHPAVAENAPAQKAESHKSETQKTAVSADHAGNNDKTSTDIALVAKEVAKKNSQTQNTHRKHASSTNDIAAVSKAAQHKANSGKTSAKTVKEEKMEALALSSHASLPNNTKVAAVSTQPVPGIATSKAVTAQPVVNSHAVAANKKNITASKADKVIAAKKVSHSGSAAVNSKTAVASSAAGIKETSVAGSQPVAKAAPVADNKAIADNAAMKEAYAINNKKGKRIIQKLVIFEHFIKTDPIDGHTDIDTISMQMLTEELGMDNENNPLLPAQKKTAARGSANTTTPVATTANNNSVAVNENAANSAASSANPQILPGASASANSKPAMGMKENATANKPAGSGASALSNLSSAFNDVKDKVTGVQFAAGLTGGINGTFFGPSSFKGFQFGVTGDFTFDQSDWSFGTALEYFHRINSNYAMNDNYYSYSPGPQSGTYTKQLILNAYNFSTLHSLEMPLIIRYTAGKFNVFVGGNLVYTFSINEGPSTLPDPTNITTTTVKENDQNPKLDASDFNSRFGFGCLFGVSCKVSPNLTLDLRNVMTLWDNANSSGAKYVSDQLYKSPSLQLSLGYRLGGKKNK